MLLEPHLEVMVVFLSRKRSSAHQAHQVPLELLAPPALGETTEPLVAMVPQVAQVSPATLVRQEDLVREDQQARMVPQETLAPPDTPELKESPASTEHLETPAALDFLAKMAHPDSPALLDRKVNPVPLDSLNPVNLALLASLDAPETTALPVFLDRKAHQALLVRLEPLAPQAINPAPQVLLAVLDSGVMLAGPACPVHPEGTEIPALLALSPAHRVLKARPEPLALTELLARTDSPAALACPERTVAQAAQALLVTPARLVALETTVALAAQVLLASLVALALPDHKANLAALV